MIKKMINNCFGALPTIYTESLSFYETVCQVLIKINEVIDEVNRNTEIVDNNNVDVESVKQQMSELSAELQRYKEELELNLANYKDGINQQMLNFAESVSGTVNDFKGEVNTKLLEQDSKITEQDETIENGLSNIQAGVPEMVAGTVRGMIQTGEFDDVIGDSFDEAVAEQVSVKAINQKRTNIYIGFMGLSADGITYEASETIPVLYTDVSGDIAITYDNYRTTEDGHDVSTFHVVELENGTYRLYSLISLIENQTGFVETINPSVSNTITNGDIPNPFASEQGGDPSTLPRRRIIMRLAKVV